MKTENAHWGVFINHRCLLIDYAAPLVGSRDVAEDVVQDAFLRASLAPIRACNKEQVLAYLYRVVRNLCFDLIRRRQMEKRHVEKDVPYWVIPQESTTPEQIAELRDEVRIVSEVLSSLPAEVRIAVEMHRFGQFTLEEIANHLDLSVSNVHRNIKSAMVKIAIRLDASRS